MKKFIVILFALQLTVTVANKVCSQSNNDLRVFGISAGALTNYPANQDFLKESVSVFYLTPYFLAGRHEFSAGILYPLKTKALYFTDDNIDPRPGFGAGYKFYIFNIYGRENLFVHYTFQYLRFKDSYTKYYYENGIPYHRTETDTYINNVIGLGYNLYLDNNARFGFFYTLDYVVSQTGFQVDPSANNQSLWITQYAWNRLSTNFGFTFRLTPTRSKEKK
ncbi:MAG: hypothetical protein ACOYNC_15870 [Bacteroidales bacterium]